MTNGNHDERNRAVGEANPPVLVIMGVSGSGKSTVAGLLAGRLGWTPQEGDDLHPAANVQKMAAGHPLTDEDRWPWLERIARWIDERSESGSPGIITCSALKRSYRDTMRRDNVVFVFLSGSRQLIGERLTARMGHYMPPSLLESQIATLEPPDPDECAVVIDVSNDPSVEVNKIFDRLGLEADNPRPGEISRCSSAVWTT